MFDKTILNGQVAHVWDNVTRVEDAPPGSTDCFYTGKVADDPSSNVFVNLCHGMTGHIRTSNGSFLIEPVEEWVDYKTPIRHILRKMNSGSSALPGNNCHSPEREHSQQGGHNHTRNKRSLSQEYYLELMVVADKKMAEYHGKDLNSYILNLMAMASHIFKDATIGNMITVTVVTLIIAKDEDFTSRKGWAEKARGYNLSSSSASEMLAKFCSWQYNTSLRPHDTALLITRENICSNPLHEKCETLGLAEVGRVCNKEFSCALVKDNGLGTAFTIAHELGHVLNMPHDEDIRCKSYNVDKRSHVMARVLDNNTFPWSWSECSRHILTEFLHAGSGNCLLNPPQEDILPDRQYVGKFLGELYDADRQCELVFGLGWTTCNFRI
ncbi:a disintegrin and metalloproteinase with thrombospondin motifs [Nesidiocoris tenuis]|uniref:A disintegrin and metalloproteinase with thrombospondin motifs n=2 Tax=Nesidiocoris tenuis TaxID=355587 RepID=A0ABN7B6J2_9HEMI|nr:a disintegrin and metalloproteinase with thrombospondin motifs [Nesidiocoris tenuis]